MIIRHGDVVPARWLAPGIEVDAVIELIRQPAARPALPQVVTVDAQRARGPTAAVGVFDLDQRLEQRLAMPAVTDGDANRILADPRQWCQVMAGVGNQLIAIERTTHEHGLGERLAIAA